MKFLPVLVWLRHYVKLPLEYPYINEAFVTQIMYT